MSWQSVLNGIDTVESWLAGVSYWVQVPVLLLVLLPTVWALAGLVDRLVEKMLWPHTRREIRLAAAEAIARHGVMAHGVDGTPEDEGTHRRTQAQVGEHVPGSAG